MKPQQYLALMAVTMLPLVTALAQSSNSTALQPIASSLSPAATEVAKLAQSRVGDDVMLAFVEQARSYYNLSADNIAALKSAGVSSSVLTAMLNHDNSLRAQSTSAVVSAAAPAPITPAVPSADNGSAPSPGNQTASAPAAVAQPPAPAPHVEVIPVSPSPDYVWAPGYWSWNGGVWIWVGGYWHYPVRPGHVWVHGYWNGSGHKHVWVGGHWR